MVVSSSNLATTLFKAIQAGIIIIDADTKYIVDINPAACIMLGVYRDDIVGTKCYDHLCSHIDDCPLGILNDEDVPNDVENQEIIIKRKDGSCLDILRTVTSIIWEDRIQIVESLINITEYKNTERKAEQCLEDKRKKLEEERNRAQMYLDIAANIFVALDKNGNITLINQTGCDVLGIDECFLLGENWFDKFVPEYERDRVKAEFDRLFEEDTEEDSNGISVFENSVLTTHNTERIIRWKNIPIRDESGKIISTFSSGEDITDQRQAEKELEHYWNDVEGLLYRNIDIIKTSVVDNLLSKHKTANRNLDKALKLLARTDMSGGEIDDN